MSWFRVDDRLHCHPKVLELLEMRGGLRALALWLLAGSWASGGSESGSVPLAAVKRLGCRKADAEALVAVGLWERDGKGYRFHDWAQYRPARTDAERAKRYRARKRDASRDGRDGDSERDTNDPVSIPDPSRPDPVPTTHTPQAVVVTPVQHAPPDTGGVRVRLMQALEWGHEGYTPPANAGNAARLRVPASFEPGYVGKFDEVMAELDTAARRVESGDLPLDKWRGTVLLTPNGYARMISENAAFVARGGSKPDDIEAERAAAREELARLEAEL